jgi:flagellar hook-basal body complex protein FliE
MNISASQVAGTYASFARGLDSAAGLEAPMVQGPNFGELLRGGVEGFVQSQASGEQMSLGSITGKANLADVVVAVTNAEVSLQAVVAIRDRVINAYQDILRMPI